LRKYKNIFLCYKDIVAKNIFMGNKYIFISYDAKIFMEGIFDGNIFVKNIFFF